MRHERLLAAITVIVVLIALYLACAIISRLPEYRGRPLTPRCGPLGGLGGAIYAVW